MRFRRSLYAIVGLGLWISTQATDLQILFIGNSHTYFNDMPEMIDSLAQAGGHDINIAVSGVGGSTLSQHYQYQPTLDSIAARDWDLIVLQEHSLLTIIDHWRDLSFYPNASRLNDLILAQGATTVFFMHQARANAQGEYCVDSYCSADFNDYFEMQAVMATSYRDLADSLSALLIPVGEYWARIHEEYPLLPLWHGDNSHASPEGGYFTACIFYQYLLGVAPLDVPYFGTLTPEQARMYQEYASQALSTTPQNLRPTELSLTSFPNPFNGEVSLKVHAEGVEPLDLTIFNHRGQIVFHEIIAIQNGTNNTLKWTPQSASGQSLPSGLYIAQVKSGAFQANSKILLLK